MSNDIVISVLPLFSVVAVSDAITAYAAYLALSVWRGLAVPIYKSRALWTGFLAMLVAVATLASHGVLLSAIPHQDEFVAAAVIYFGVYPATIAALFIWIDRTIFTLIRLDYLRRDILGWGSSRLAYWGFVVGLLLLYYVGFAYQTLLNVTLLVGSAAVIGGIVLLALLLVPITYGSAALIVGSKRTRDMTFRSHAKWGGYCLLAIIIVTVAYQATPDYVLESLPFPLISYCIYKMAKSLVPIGNLSPSSGSSDKIAVAGI